MVGRNGETIRSISRASGARVYIDRTRDEYRDVEREVQITGTQTQIDLAKVRERERERERDRQTDRQTAPDRQMVCI